MDWIKVKVKHAEYDFTTAPDNVFRAWIMMMILVAACERIPTKEELDARLGKVNHKDLCGYLLRNGYDMQHIMDKVMEDVRQILNHRATGKARQAKFRGIQAQSNELHNANITGAEKIREDKRRGDTKTVLTGPNDEKPKSIPRKHFKDLGRPDPKEQEAVAAMISKDKTKIGL